MADFNLFGILRENWRVARIWLEDRLRDVEDLLRGWEPLHYLLFLAAVVALWAVVKRCR